MKAYIRTKDGRIFAPINAYYLKEDGSLICYEIGKDERGEPIMVDANLVIKATDTIEELCDEYVKKSKENKNDFFEISKDYLKIFDRKYHKEDLEHYNYYGAIWTEKGLIYVAKMNEKGELEFI